MSNIGYIRVSKTCQTTDRQLAGVTLDKTFEDKATGRNFDRPAFKEMMAYVRAGDVVHVHSLDRLGRNLEMMLEVVADLTKKGVALVAHKEGIDTTKKSPMQTAFLQMMGMFAELEVNMAQERRAEAAAINPKPRGYGKGIQRDEIAAALAAGGSIASVAAQFNVGKSTVQRIKAEAKTTPAE